MKDDRAVTEVLGYVLIIALVTVMIAIVMTVGIGGLEASQDAEQINNMERGFDVLSHNIEELVTGKAPHRSTELRLGDGSLQYGDPVELSITLDGQLLGNETLRTYPIVYQHGTGTSISYESGGVIREGKQSSTLLNRPLQISDNDHILVHGIRTRPAADTPERIDRTGTVQIRKEHIQTTVRQNVTDGEIHISVVSDNSAAWESYLSEHHPGEVVHSNQSAVVYRYDVPGKVEVSFIQSIVRVEFTD